MRRPILQTAVAVAAATLLTATLAGCGQKGPLVPADSPEARKSRPGRSPSPAAPTPQSDPRSATQSAPTPLTDAPSADRDGPTSKR